MTYAVSWRVPARRLAWAEQPDLDSGDYCGCLFLRAGGCWCKGFRRLVVRQEDLAGEVVQEVAALQAVHDRAPRLGQVQADAAS